VELSFDVGEKLFFIVNLQSIKRGFYMLFVAFLTLASGLSFAQWSPDQSRLLEGKLSLQTCEVIVKIKQKEYDQHFSKFKKSKIYKTFSSADLETYHQEWKNVIEEYQSECRAAIGTGITGNDFCVVQKGKNPDFGSGPC
jgi:hypothetical protein